MNFDPNGLYHWMVKIYSENKTEDNKIQIFNEGGSRSSKTWDAFHFIVTFCDHNRNSDKPLEIYILRKTLTECRDKTFEEFKKVLQIIGIYDRECHTSFPKPNYNLWGNIIKFRGLDDEKDSEGYPSDITFVNEMLEIENESLIAGIKMRCRKLFMGDWNPKFTQHWAFEYEGRPDTYFSKTTYKNNKHLEKSVVKEIQSYDPNIEENVKNGTADEWRHKVYGKGERANRDGLVFPNVTWIDKYPETGLDKELYGLDFGYTQDPSALVKVGFKAIKTEGKKSNLYLQLKLYQPTKDVDLLINAIKAVEPNIKDYRVWADSADPLMIADLRRMGLSIFAVNKFKGSITYGIDLINRFNIHIVYDADFKKEQENYCYKTIHGIATNEPIDKHNHAMDATRYPVISELRRFYIK